MLEIIVSASIYVHKNRNLHLGVCKDNEKSSESILTIDTVYYDLKLIVASGLNNCYSKIYFLGKGSLGPSGISTQQSTFSEN